MEVKKICATDVSGLKIKRVAAYARVSADKYAMLHSLENQIEYYRDYIQNYPGWVFAGVYADNALTGTNEDRPQFQQLMADCKAGKIDFIVTKKVSRFSRNIVDTLSRVRELKAMGIGIYFEQEDLNTLVEKDEMRLVFMSLHADKQAEATSDYCKLAVRRRFERGIPSPANIYGYKYVKNHFEVIPAEAEIIKWIFDMYLSGLGLTLIAKKLNKKGVKPRMSDQWSEITLYGTIRNEKYTGNMMLQKTFVGDYITKKKVMNNGELKKFYVEGSHEAIIAPERFEKVQTEIRRRAAIYGVKVAKPKPEYLFTRLIKCGGCGRSYIHKCGYKKKPYWVCTKSHVQGQERCQACRLPEDILVDNTKAVIMAISGEECRELTRDLIVQFIDHIDVPEKYLLTFVLKDGRKIDVEWQHKSRKESWTPEMKKKASEKTILQHKVQKGELNAKNV